MPQPRPWLRPRLASPRNRNRARPAGFTIQDDLGPGNCPVLTEKLHQVVVRATPREVAHINVDHRHKLQSGWVVPPNARLAMIIGWTRGRAPIENKGYGLIRRRQAIHAPAYGVVWSRRAGAASTRERTKTGSGPVGSPTESAARPEEVFRFRRISSTSPGSLSIKSRIYLGDYSLQAIFSAESEKS